MDTQSTIAAPKLLNMHQVCALTGFTRVHINNLANTGRMPKPLKIGRSIRWRASDIDAWIDAGCPCVESMRPATRSK